MAQQAWQTTKGWDPNFKINNQNDISLWEKATGQQWNSAWGHPWETAKGDTAAGAPKANAGATGGLLASDPTDVTQWDPNLKPTSSSSSSSIQGSQSGSTSWTGLPGWTLPSVKPVVQGNPALWQETGGLLQSYMSPDAFMGRFDPTARAITEDMNSRGLVGGSVMAKELSKAAADQYAKEQATGLAAYQNMINSMNDLIGSARESTSSSSSSSGGSSKSESYQEDPTQMYDIISRIITGMYA